MNPLSIFFESASPYSLHEQVKDSLLTDHLLKLDDYHYANCVPYRNIASTLPERSDQGLLIPVRLFKTISLKSVADEEVFRTLTSSGTTSQLVSRIYLDRETAQNQSKALVKIMQSYLGKKRRPMLIIDHPNVISDRAEFSARGAGIRGLSTFGYDHTYALNDDMSVNYTAIDAFVEKYAQVPVFLFGFTFMVWSYFVQKLVAKGFKFPQGSVLIHSGGWKKLQDKAVSNSVFKEGVYENIGVSHVHNFYGMVEQVGSIFVECEYGVLHAPDYADISIIDPRTREALPYGEKGLVALQSVIPSSYPGHRILSEDLGTILGVDSCRCGRLGKYFEIHGRLAKAEARGCSDTHAN